MKLESKNSEFRTNAKNQQGFTIAANAKMFEILYSKIYTYKIDAIVRELAANAYDSHVEAGQKDVPFNVVLPNPMYPYFEIEDFGIGMDNDDVMEIYTSYGTSTKTQTNDLIGGLGLGSKTPFAYTDMFTIRARKNLVERTYTAYIGADGRPTVSMLNEKPTDQHNGVQIKIPVKSGDMGSFKASCEFILSLYDPVPHVTGSGFQFCVDHQAISRLKDYSIIFSKTLKEVTSQLYGNGGNSSIFVIMGNVAYPIKLYSLSVTLRSDLYSMLSSKYNQTIFIRFPIGSLEISASREALSFDSEGVTMRALCDGIEKGAIESLSGVTSKLKDVSNFKEVCSVIFDEFGYYNVNIFSNFFSNQMVFKGMKFNKYFNMITRRYNERFISSKFEVEAVGNYKFFSYRNIQTRHTNKITYKLHPDSAEFIFNSIDPSVDVIVLYETGPKMLRRTIAAENLLEGRTSKAMVIYTLKKQCYQKDIDAMKVLFPTVRFEKISDNNTSTKVRATQMKSKHANKLDVFDLTSYGLSKVYTTEADFKNTFDPSTSAVYRYEKAQDVTALLGIPLRVQPHNYYFINTFRHISQVMKNPNVKHIVFMRQLKNRKRFFDDNNIENIDQLKNALLDDDELISLFSVRNTPNKVVCVNRNVQIKLNICNYDMLSDIVGDLYKSKHGLEEKKVIDDSITVIQKYINDRYRHMDAKTLNDILYSILLFNTGLIFKLRPGLYDKWIEACKARRTLTGALTKWEELVQNVIRTKAPLLLPLVCRNMEGLSKQELTAYNAAAKTYFEKMTTQEYVEESAEECMV